METIETIISILILLAFILISALIIRVFLTYLRKGQKKRIVKGNPKTIADRFMPDFQDRILQLEYNTEVIEASDMPVMFSEEIQAMMPNPELRIRCLW